MSWQKDSTLTNEHALNREPVPLNAGYHMERSTKLSKLSSCQPSPAYRMYADDTATSFMQMLMWIQYS